MGALLALAVVTVSAGSGTATTNLPSSVTAREADLSGGMLSEADPGLVRWSVGTGGNGHWYRLSPRPVELGEAIRLARPGYVVSVLSEAEKDFLVRSFGSRDLFLIGYTDRDEEGSWTWVSGEPSGYEYWASGEPNNCGSDPNSNVPGCVDEDVVVMNWQRQGGPPEPPGAWNDQPGSGRSETRYAIFEYETLGRPDARIRRARSGGLVGNDIYNGTGAAQTATGSAAQGRTVTYFVSVQNDAQFTERLRLRGGGSTRAFMVHYATLAGSDITRRMVAGTYSTPRLAPRAAHTIRATVTIRDTAAPGASLTGNLTATSTTHPTRRDTVRFVTSRA